VPDGNRGNGTYTCSHIDSYALEEGPVIKIGPKPAHAVGGQATIVITVTNQHTVNLYYVRTDYEPSPPSWVASSTCPRLNQVATDTFQSPVEPGTSVTYTCAVTVDAGISGTFPFTMRVRSLDPFEQVAYLGDSDATVIIVPAAPLTPAISISKQADEPVVAGRSSVSFTILVTNTGLANLTNVQVSDPAAAGCNATIGSLLAGATASPITCVMTNVTGTIVNTATVSADVAGGGTISASASANALVLPRIYFLPLIYATPVLTP
jgi:uncharacterized repeat protein (TIGR01451 family)